MPPAEHAELPNEEKPQNFKLVMRRLPPGMTKEDLMHQIEPLDGCSAVWFRRADLQLGPWAFARAYVVFEEWEKAAEFFQRFHNYVFLDRNGAQSAAVVELALHPDVPPSFPADAKKNDDRSGTLEKKEEYTSFLKEYNELSTKKVVNFEHLLLEMEQKEKQLESGQVRETPLTNFLVQQAMEKEKKRLARLENLKQKQAKLAADGKKKDLRNEVRTAKTKKNDVDEAKPEEPKEKKRNRRGKKGGQKEDKAAVEEFGGKKPILLKREPSAKNLDEAKAEQPASSNGLPSSSKPNGTTGGIKPKPPKAKKPEASAEGGAEENDEKKKERRPRPERALYRPPVRNREAAGKKEPSAVPKP